MFNDFIFDYETFGTTGKAPLIDMAVVPFRDDAYENPPTFEELVASGTRIKFRIKGQGRISEKEVVDFWKSQPAEVKKRLLSPSPDDVGLLEGFEKALEFMYQNGVDFYKSHQWCRGNNFDYPIFDELFRMKTGKLYIADHTPIHFSRARCIRTAIEQNLNIRNATECPLRIGLLPGFVHHDSVHDCAKDILQLLYSKRYAFGLDTPPPLEETEPVTRPKIRT
jgi:hypothetical protein